MLRPEVSPAASQGPEWLVDARVEQQLYAFEARLQELVHADHPVLHTTVNRLVLQRGKRLRPALLFLAGAFGPADHNLLDAAVGMEILHIASLYHDDIIDHGTTRRNSATVNHEWGNAWASVAGTYLFAVASQLFSTLPLEADMAVSRACVLLATGEFNQAENAYQLDLTEADYLRIVEEKTVPLFQLPCELGAHLSDADAPTSQALLEYARHLGLAFQLIDDSLDFLGDAEVGKNTEHDLVQGFYSLPVLRVLGGECGASESQRLHDLLADRHPVRGARLVDAIRIVHASGADDYARQLALDYARRAQQALAVLPRSPARESLLRLAEFVHSRRS